MDDRTGRHSKAEASGQRYKQIKSYGRKAWKALKPHFNLLLTSLLIAACIVLLFAIASQLHAPATNTVSDGEDTVDYSMLIKQIDVGNVLAVVIQGNEVHGLLAHDLTQHGTSTHQNMPKNISSSSDYINWQRTFDGSNASLTSTATVPPALANRSIYTLIPTGANGLLMTSLQNQHVLFTTLSVAQSRGWMTYVWQLLPIIFILIVLLIFILYRRTQNPAREMDKHITQLGKNRVRRFERAKENTSTRGQKPSALTPRNGVNSSKQTSARISVIPDVTFADVAGIDEVRSELQEIVQFLRDPHLFNRLGARLPCGALLVGPPGTGKTLLARAVAGEAGVPFFSMSASEFVEMFVGVGASRVRDLFNQARQVSPCVIFIDELDAVGRKRSMRVSGNDERDQTLNQLLVELDGFDERQAVVVLAATNRADILDNALLRPGRFDRRISVSPPDRVGREAILNVHTRHTPLHEEVNLERLARLTVGMTGADLANLVNEAALVAARRELDSVDHECFEDALARVQLGALRPLVMNEEQRRIIAIHESGHALVAYHLPEADTVNRVTILPRGQSLGVTQFTAEADRYNYSRTMLMTRIAVGLGGRAAEELTFGADQVTTGAENDLQVVTDLAYRMVTRWGMSERVGVVFTDYQPDGEHTLNMRRSDLGVMPARSLVADASGNVRLDGDMESRSWQFAMQSPASRNNVHGGMMNTLVDAEVQRILNEGRTMARVVLVEHERQLVLLADTLMEREQLDRAQFETLLKG